MIDVPLFLSNTHKPIQGPTTNIYDEFKKLEGTNRLNICFHSYTAYYLLMLLDQATCNKASSTIHPEKWVKLSCRS